MTRHLPAPFVLKAWLGGSGLVTGLAGMVLEWRWLVWVAVGFLATAFLLRLVAHHKS